MRDFPAASYDAWKTRSPDDDLGDGECPYCGGEGFIFDCFDGCCLDADVGCDDCTRTCPECSHRSGDET